MQYGMKDVVSGQLLLAIRNSVLAYAVDPLNTSNIDTIFDWKSSLG